jgi:hypothetical protein
MRTSPVSQPAATGQPPADTQAPQDLGAPTPDSWTIVDGEFTGDAIIVADFIAEEVRVWP